MNTVLDFVRSPDQVGRRNTLLESLAPLRAHVAGKRVLDFGASSGLSMSALCEIGACEVVGVEISAERVEVGRKLLAAYSNAQLLHTPDTTSIPIDSYSFDTVLCNAVMEHIPQPRDKHIQEMWRALKVGGVLIVNETPNKYLPLDYHTTKLWGVPWLPCKTAFNYARWRGRYKKDFGEWQGSGWRGVGYYEMKRNLPGARFLPEDSRLRHRILTALGLPASLLDPYPCWVLRKS